MFLQQIRPLKCKDNARKERAYGVLGSLEDKTIVDIGGGPVQDRLLYST